MKAKINLFVGWYMTLQVFFSTILAQLGAVLLGLLGMSVPSARHYGGLVAALMLLAVLLILRNTVGELPPGTGKPGGKGYKLGHGLVLASSVLALGTYVLPFFISSIQNPGTVDALSTFSIGIMYPSLALFGIGLSFIYQSTLPPATNPQP